MQSVLITGGAGFIGQNLVHAWRAARPADRLVVVDAVTYAANLRSLEPLIADRSILFVKGDIGDAALMRRLFEEHKFTRVAHLAAESHVDRSIADPEAFLQTNVLGTFTLLRAALDAWRSAGTLDHSRFLHVSTDEVYGSLQLTDPAFSESSPYRPNSPYAASKAASDHLVRAYVETYRPAGADHQLLEQLRFLSASGKADPADDHSCAGGKVAADLRRRLQCPRLAARIRSLRRR